MCFRNDVTRRASRLDCLLSPHADRHTGKSFTVCVFVFVRMIFGNGYVRRGLTEGDEIL